MANTRRVTVTLDAGVVAAAERIAKARGESAASVIRQAVTVGLASIGQVGALELARRAVDEGRIAR